MDNTPAGTKAQIYNVVLTLAGTEYFQEIQDGVNSSPSVKAIMFRLQSLTHTLQYSFTPGGPYFDLKAGEIYWKDGLHMFSTTIYFKSPDAGTIVDLEVWR